MNLSTRVHGKAASAARGLPVALALAWFAGLAVILVQGPLLTVAANRLVPGVPVTGRACLGAALPALLALSALAAALLAAVPGRRAGAAALTLLLVGAGFLAWGIGHGAALRMAGEPPAARAGLGAAAWLAAALLAAALGVALRRVRRPGAGIATTFLLVLGLVAAGRTGTFEALSLAVEYAARRTALQAAFVEHLALAGGALALAVPVTIGLSLWQRGQSLVGIVVGSLQVVPAVALLGALVALTGGLLRAMPALRDFGLSALGQGPAMVGIAAYLLLPLWRGLASALRAPDPASLDAARAMGLTDMQILSRLRLPLGAPQLVGALRVATVQAIGLATLGALIGAGGLGRIVFDGMAQFAPDLILLGAVPVIGLSLVAERALSAVEGRMRVGAPA